MGTEIADTNETAKPNPNKEYKSKTAKALSKVLEDEELIDIFDEYKQSTRKDDIFKNKMHDVVSKIEIKLSACLFQLKEDFNSWESNWFVANHLKSLTLEDVENDIYANEIRKKLNICKALQKHFIEWKF